MVPEDAQALRDLPGDPVRRRKRQHAHAADLRQPELEHEHRGHERRHAGDPLVADEVRLVLHRRGRQGRGQGRRARLERVRQRSSARASTRPTRRCFASATTSSACSASWRPRAPSPGGQNMDDQVFAPYTTVMKKLSGQLNLNRIYVSAAISGRHRRRGGGDHRRAAHAPRDHARRPGRLHRPDAGRHRRAPHADDAAR